MKKVRKGSSLVLVICIMSIIFIAGTGILSLSYHSYQYRQVEEKEKANFYSAESGLDKAYVIIENYIVKAIEAGNQASSKENINKDIVFKASYKDSIINNLNSLMSEINNIDNPDFVVSVESIINSMKDKGEMILKLKSSSKNPSFNRIITADFVIKEATLGSSGIITLPKNVVWTKAISADGNFIVNNCNLEINNGDVFVKGTTQSITSNKGDKGVIVKGNGTTLNLKGGNLITNENVYFNETNNKLLVNGNVYGKNILLDFASNNTKININTDSNNINSGSIFLLDDLEMNGKSMEVAINGGYYGLSDGSQAMNNEPDSSSSININTEDLGNGSKLSIAQDVIIAGVAYIDVKGPDGTTKYKTGESISIKGNYKAYTAPIAEISQSDVFEYFDPLVLVNKKKSDLKDELVDLSVSEKAKYVEVYEKLKNLKLGNGIEIKSNDKNYTRIYTGIGFENNVALSNRTLIPNSDKLITPFRSGAKDEIFYMGAAVDYGITGDNRDNFLNSIVSVNTNVDFSKLPTLNNFNESELFVYNKDSASIHLKGYNSSFSTSAVNPLGETLKDIGYKGIIISKGDIFISGKFNFTGTIICGGNIYFEDSNTKKITYDETYVNNLMLNNYNVMKDVFINYYPKDEGKYLKATIFENGELKNIESLIQRRNWNIVK